MRQGATDMKKTLSALTLAAALAAAVPAPAQSGPGSGQAVPSGQGAAVGGNKVLMDEWAARRRQIRDTVLERLKQQGKVPRDGAIEFEARFKPDPKDPAKLFVAVDAVRITPYAPGTPPGRPEHVSGPAGTQAIDLALAPMAVPGRTENLSLDIPMAAAFKETVTLRDGRVEEAPAFAPAPAPASMPGGGAAQGAAPGGDAGAWGAVKAFWKRIVDFFGS
jgi:hypothetical protein